MTAADWQAKGNCVGVDLALMFPVRGEDARDAKAVCRGCVVREECLEYALENSIQHGVFGGYSERQRRKMRAARIRARRLLPPEEAA